MDQDLDEKTSWAIARVKLHSQVHIELGLQVLTQPAQGHHSSYLASKGTRLSCFNVKTKLL